MTTQDTIATAGNPSIQREFSKGSATDGQWNNMTSTLSSQAIGLELPNVQITRLQGNYTAGAAVLRIISGKTLKVKAHMLANKIGFSCVHEAQLMPPVRLMTDDLLQIYPVVVDSDANDTNVLALVKTSAGTLPFTCSTTADNTATEIKELNTDQSVGDVFFGSVIQEFQIQCQDGATLNKVTIVDSQGGTQITLFGGVRAQAGSTSNIYNLKASANIPIQKGWKMYIYATK